MAIYAHGVDAAAVIAQYPRGRGVDITETSAGLNLPLVRTLIDQAAGTVNAALESQGYTGSDLATQLTDSARAVTAGAIVQYVIGRMLRVVGAVDEAQLYMDQWSEALTMIRSMPEYLGEAQPEGAQVHSNLPTEATPNAWSVKGWRGW